MINRVMIYALSSLVLVHLSKEKIKVKKLVLSVLLITGLAASNVDAGNLKVGVVSVERILTEAPQVDAVNTSMLERFGPQRDTLQSMEKEITKMQENYKRNELVMTEDKLNALKKDIITKIQGLKQKEASLQQEVATVRNQELAVLQQQVRGIIDDIAKKGKYSLILSEGVAFADDKLDITSKVLDKMKSAFKKK
ncbi:MAG TPA: OmpH family outer membrane protein [Gammaproteobacteria bacterium]|nr:OmpH family outer membrane protein [Gammaproteobacteria bacterium]